MEFRFWCIVLLYLCGASLVWSVWDKWMGYRKKRPPGPMRIPILGNLLLMLPAVMDPTKSKSSSYFLNNWVNFKPAYIIIHSMTKIFGPIMSLKFGINHAIIVGSSKYVKEVFCREEFTHRYADDWFTERSFGKPLGLIFINDEPYKKIKNFTVRNLKDFGFGKKQTMEAAVEEELLQFLDYFQEKSKRSGGVVHMEHAFTLPVLNILWNMVAGSRFSYEDQKLKTLISDVEELSRSFDIGGNILMAFPLLRYVAPELTGHTQQMGIYRKLHEYFRSMLTERRVLGSYSENPRDFVDIFLQKMDENNNSESDEKDLYTEEQFIMVCLDLFTAGSETNANTLDFGILYMILNPGVQRKVQAEIDEVIGKSRLPVYADRLNMPYTEATILEIQRMCNVIPLVHRVCTKDTVLGGYHIKKKDVMIANLHSVHMDEQVWDNPGQFRPERFLSSSGSLKPSSHFLPFGIGKRVCIGEALAKLTLFMYFTAVLQRFSFSKAPGYPPPSENPGKGFTVCPDAFYALVKTRV
ncbi:unnamed protein product [Allacma fusca]|uniref:Cytochrome P450 n=1 Tax=Allacma fusca TaxID=39272 RepID=A0A8J2PCK7_9HEXA|nr:unnamed protein product [Allacma fusca]